MRIVNIKKIIACIAMFKNNFFVFLTQFCKYYMLYKCRHLYTTFLIKIYLQNGFL